MTGVFVDTNVLVYARDASEPLRQPVARAWLDHLWAAGAGRLSTQVLNEYYVTVTHKLKPGLPASAARADVLDLGTWRPIAIDGHVIETAWTIEDRYGLSWWDSLIVASAQHLECDRLLSEGLQAGQRFGGVTVIDPFTTEPG